MKTTKEIKNSIEFKLALTLAYLMFVGTVLMAGWYFSTASYFASL
jgi:hypothetical protein